MKKIFPRYLIHCVIRATMVWFQQTNLSIIRKKWCIFIVQLSKVFVNDRRRGMSTIRRNITALKHMCPIWNYSDNRIRDTPFEIPRGCLCWNPYNTITQRHRVFAFSYTFNNILNETYLRLSICRWDYLFSSSKKIVIMRGVAQFYAIAFAWVCKGSTLVTLQ